MGFLKNIPMLAKRGLFRPRNISRCFNTSIRRNKSTLGNALRSPGIVSPTRIVPPSIKVPPYVNKSLKQQHEDDDDLFSNIVIHNEHQIEKMRRSCRLAKKVLNYCGSLIRVCSCEYRMSNQ